MWLIYLQLQAIKGIGSCLAYASSKGALNTSPLYSIIIGLFTIWTLTWINSKEIKTIGFVQKITVVLKVIPIILVGVIGIFFIDLNNFYSLEIGNEFSFNSITVTTTLDLFRLFRNGKCYNSK